MLVKLIKKGAEADIYTGMWNTSKSIFKIRKIKNYRNSLLDSKIRKQRTIKESQILSQVKSFGIPSPLVYFVNLEKSMIVMQEIPGKPVHDLSDSKIIEVSNSISMDQLSEIISKTSPKMGEFIREKKVMISVNEEMADSDTIIHDGDEVAFLPPFSGGS